MDKIGWQDFRYMSSKESSIDNEELENFLGNINFYSETISTFKVPDLIEDICEDYGQFVKYNGGITNNEFYFDLDDHHRFS